MATSRASSARLAPWCDSMWSSTRSRSVIPALLAVSSAHLPALESHAHPVLLALGPHHVRAPVRVGGRHLRARRAARARHGEALHHAPAGGLDAREQEAAAPRGI